MASLGKVNLCDFPCNYFIVCAALTRRIKNAIKDAIKDEREVDVGKMKQIFSYPHKDKLSCPEC
jgi:hypothetical protein